MMRDCLQGYSRQWCNAADSLSDDMVWDYFYKVWTAFDDEDDIQVSGEQVSLHDRDKQVFSCKNKQEMMQNQTTFVFYKQVTYKNSHFLFRKI